PLAFLVIGGSGCRAKEVERTVEPVDRDIDGPCFGRSPAQYRAIAARREPAPQIGLDPDFALEAYHRAARLTRGLVLFSSTIRSSLRPPVTGKPRSSSKRRMATWVRPPSSPSAEPGS